MWVHSAVAWFAIPLLEATTSALDSAFLNRVSSDDPTGDSEQLLPGRELPDAEEMEQEDMHQFVLPAHDGRGVAAQEGVAADSTPAKTSSGGSTSCSVTSQRR